MDRHEIMTRAWEAARMALGATLGAAKPDNGPWRVDVEGGRVRLVGTADDEIVWDGLPIDAIDLAERFIGAALAAIGAGEYREGGDA